MNQRESTTESSRSESGGTEPDYSAVEVPAKVPAEFDVDERRADLLEQIRDLGHPRALPAQRELGDRYGVSQQQISKDLDAIADHITENLGRRRDLVTESVFHRSITALLEEGEYRKAAQTVKDWNDWLTDRKDLKDIEEELRLLKDAIDL